MKKLIIPALLASLLAACSSTPTNEQTAAPVENHGANSGIPTVTADVKGSGLPAVLTDSSSILSKRSVYFDLDSYEVKPEFKNLVAAHAKFLNENRSFKVLIQGNTDERGSSEYNLSLGQKRADALKKNLQLLGVSDSQMESVSLGKEKPKSEGHDESSWAENRRDDILYRAPDGRGEF